MNELVSARRVRRLSLLRYPVLAALALGAASMPAACGGYTPEDYCNDICDCEGCSDEELDACIDDAQDLYDRAEKEGCDDKADEYLACLGDEVECRGGDLDADGCEKEYEEAAKCAFGGSGFSGGPSDDDSGSTPAPGGPGQGGAPGGGGGAGGASGGG